MAIEQLTSLYPMGTRVYVWSDVAVTGVVVGHGNISVSTAMLHPCYIVELDDEIVLGRHFPSRIAVFPTDVVRDPE